MTGDSIPLMIREPKDGNPWTWLMSSDNLFSELIEFTCTGTETDVMVKVYRNILLLKALDGSLKACIILSGDKDDNTIPPIDL